MLRAVLIVVCVLAGQPAWAHAVLLATQPADGAALEKAPAEIVLRFNEPVAPVALRVLDATGADRAMATPRAQDNEIRLELPELPTGGYVVSWRVVSADSHPIGGGFIYTVGQASLPGPYTAGDARRETGWTIAIIVNRFVLYAALMFVAGGALFAFFVLRPLRIGVAGLDYWRLRATVLGLFAALLAIGLKGGQLGAFPAGALVDTVAWRLGFATSTATSTLTIITGLGIILAAGYSRRWRSWLEVLGAVIALTGLSVTGHAATGPDWVRMTAAAHALLAGFWLGAFWPLLRLIPAHPAAALAAARQFSHLAVPALLALAATGLGMALLRITSLGQLVGSPYGQLLVLKLLIVAALLVVAAANRWQATPALAAGRRGATEDLMRNLRLEIGLGATVLLLTAVLAHTPPPGMAAHDHAHGAESGHTTWISQRNRALMLEVLPAVTGPNRVTARFMSLSGDLLAPQEASISFARLAAGVEPITRPLTRGRNDVFRLGRIDLPLAGLWTVRVEALIDDFEKAVFEIEVPISAPPRR